ncbi:MAG: hypothetical protein AB7U83_03385 [Vicinamibacterales bacterium]
MASRILAFVAAIVVAACSGEPSTGPRFNPPNAPSPPSGDALRQIAVVDGWTGAPVAGVRVLTADGSVATDAAGGATVPVRCATATFTAAGFLERRVACLSATVEGGRPVTLWPVRDERESLETRHFLGGLTTTRPDDVPTYLSQDVEARPGVPAVWEAAAAEIRRLTANRWITVRSTTAGGPQTGGDFFVVAATPDQSGCDHPWFVSRIRLDRFGFCVGQSSSYFGFTLRVSEAQLAAPDVALRVLLFASGAAEHEMPGLLNAGRPASALSEFERKTLHMVGLRGRVGWPDDELCAECR